MAFAWRDETTGFQHRAVGDGALDHGVDVLLRTGVDQRPHQAGVGGAVTEFHGADFFFQQAEEFVVDAFLHINPLDCRA
ncbi:hypothetical protein D3C85_1404760 [compost metagenome]